MVPSHVSQVQGIWGIGPPNGREVTAYGLLTERLNWEAITV